MGKKTNPNGANQYQLDPRQKLCWDYYINPDSETFSNAYRSALKAGFEDSTALNITVDPWFVEKSRTLNMLDKAEKVLNDVLEDIRSDDKILKIKQDTAKFVAGTVGKYSQKVDITSKGEKVMGINYIVPNGNNNSANLETTPSVPSP